MAGLKPTFLVILDGWGLAGPGPGTAATLARAPALNKLLACPSRATLACCGREVGLPSGFMGNSEVGHMNIGAGRIVYQDMTRIDLSIENNTLRGNRTLADLFEKAANASGAVHFMGLLSDGGVHSHIDHLYALLALAAEYPVRAYVHAFMDGRDTAPTSGADYIRQLLRKMEELRSGQLASVIGRYYAMDRDNRWERSKLAWELLTRGEGESVGDAVEAMKEAYANGETDEFIKPRVLLQKNSEKIAVKDGDALFFFNFRADRARQLSACFARKTFSGFERGKRPLLSGFACMTRYDEQLSVPAAFEPLSVSDVLGEVVSALGVKQLRIAETEKYAHVTYFFNGGREELFAGEDRQLVPSPRDVATYDLKPEMSAMQVKDTLIAEWKKWRYPFVVCNFANADMVGHTGVIPAAVKAVETVDRCVDELWRFARQENIRLIITADHGNVEELLTPDHRPMTAHSLNKVAFVILEEGRDIKLAPEGKLGDIAPTILNLWGVPVPAAMTGTSLLRDSGSG
jgi:2,3-bisphosphoglycerate-independent phosphoglycerate mutase